MQCPICLAGFDEDGQNDATVRDDDTRPDAVAVLTCGHRFHVNCIRPWLETASTCPMCRTHTAPIVIDMLVASARSLPASSHHITDEDEGEAVDSEPASSDDESQHMLSWTFTAVGCCMSWYLLTWYAMNVPVTWG